jgi:DNA repair exonuclease SbcCD nuclease subunit
MKIAHVADVHLGHRRFGEVTVGMRNQREQDVSDAWRAAIDGILAQDVQLVLIAGDIFDTGRPSVAAITDGMRGVARLVKAKIPVLAVSGQHDERGVANAGATGSEYTGSPLAPLAVLGAKVVRESERVSIPSLGCHVLLVPESDVMRIALEPSTASGIHLLCAHGRFNASLYRLPEAECLSPDAISDQFQFCALGDFHVATEVKPRVWYSGSLEYTSTNVWSELDQPKGWLLADLDAGTVTLQPVPCRRHLDLPAFSAHGLTSQQITERVIANLAAVDIHGAVIRQLIHDARRGLVSDLDHRTLKAAKAGALNFQLDTKALERIMAKAIVPGSEISDDGPDWLDDFNADEPLPQSDDFSIYDAFQRGELPQEIAA